MKNLEFNLDNLTIGQYRDVCMSSGLPTLEAIARTIDVIAASVNEPILEWSFREIRNVLAQFSAAVVYEINLFRDHKGDALSLRPDMRADSYIPKDEEDGEA